MSPTRSMRGSKAPVEGNVELLKKLLKAIEETDISELTYEEDGVKIHLRRGPAGIEMMPGNGAFAMPMVAAPQAASTAKSEGAPKQEGAKASAPAALPANYKSILSPFVGTFYRSPAPTAPMFVQEGQEISPGDVLCIVEAMKLMNEIESECHARVAKILVENGSPVEFNQELFLLELLS